ncbi:hypothetical protein OROGR_026056 [Orobanche gracilis]
MAGTRIIKILFLSIFYYSSPSLAVAARPTYNVQSIGAKPDGKTDCTNAFLSAWGSACASTDPATIYVPPGRYLLRNACFAGKLCRNTAIAIRIDGTLVAPSDYTVLGRSGTWLQFESVSGVSIHGGTLDGQGIKLWACKNISGGSCPKGATVEMFHILVDGCHNVKLMNLKISAPENSPNTDGIHVEQSTAVTIMNSHIGTGDDCVSIGPGTSDLWIENMYCGPGHGISIGSLGRELQESGVQNVTVKTTTFSGTQNGVRVRHGHVLAMDSLETFFSSMLLWSMSKTPLLSTKTTARIAKIVRPGYNASGVKISNVTYKDIHGTSATQVAVKFECSKMKPCSGIMLSGVNLTYGGKQAAAAAACANAGGTTKGLVNPTSCL